MADDSLAGFIDEASTDSRLRVEQDLGGGFVRLRLTEAERRQAAQDIRSSEDVLIELLRNARDAGAHQMYVALQREGSRRIITLIDDGNGIPESMHDRIFEPRVTSKLDTAHMDKWGMHGRGMALFSIRENAEEAQVAFSALGLGSSMRVTTDAARISERADQSTFPRFELSKDGVASMRGPRNLLRTAAEFALEHRGECAVYCGSPAEMAATLFAFGMAVTTPSARAFAPGLSELPLTRWLACACDPEEFAARAGLMGLDLSARTARRIMDGQMAPVPPLMEMLEAELATARAAEGKGRVVRKKGAARGAACAPKLTAEDRQELVEGASKAFAPIAERYYLDPSVDPQVSVGSDTITITVPLVPED